MPQHRRAHHYLLTCSWQKKGWLRGLPSSKRGGFLEDYVTILAWEDCSTCPWAAARRNTMVVTQASLFPNLMILDLALPRLCCSNAIRILRGVPPIKMLNLWVINFYERRRVQTGTGRKYVFNTTAVVGRTAGWQYVNFAERWVGCQWKRKPGNKNILAHRWKPRALWDERFGCGRNGDDMPSNESTIPLYLRNKRRRIQTRIHLGCWHLVPITTHPLLDGLRQAEDHDTVLADFYMTSYVRDIGDTAEQDFYVLLLGTWMHLYYWL